MDKNSLILLDSTVHLVNMLFGRGIESDSLWKTITQYCKEHFRVIITKDDIIGGYLLASLVERIGLNCDFRQSSFDKHEVDFFGKDDNLPKDLFTGFRIKIRRYNLGGLSQKAQDVQQILANEPIAENFKYLMHSLNLKEEPIPNNF